MVENRILYNNLPRWQAIRANKQWYDPIALYEWTRQNPTVPHSRRPLGYTELTRIVREAADVAARRGHPSAQQLALAAQRHPVGSARRRTATKRPMRYHEGRAVFFRRPRSAAQFVVEEANSAGFGDWVVFMVTSAVHAFRWNPVTSAWDDLELDRHDKTILLLRPSKVEWTMHFSARTGEGTNWQPFVHGSITEWHRPDTRSAFRRHRSDDWYNALRAHFPNYMALWDGLLNVESLDPTLR